jgi:hypothetical protein
MPFLAGVICFVLSFAFGVLAKLPKKGADSEDFAVLVICGLTSIIIGFSFSLMLLGMFDLLDFKLRGFAPVAFVLAMSSMPGALGLILADAVKAKAAELEGEDSCDHS